MWRGIDWCKNFWGQSRFRVRIFTLKIATSGDGGHAKFQILGEWAKLDLCQFLVRDNPWIPPVQTSFLFGLFLGTSLPIKGISLSRSHSLSINVNILLLTWYLFKYSVCHIKTNLITFSIIYFPQSLNLFPFAKILEAFAKLKLESQ